MYKAVFEGLLEATDRESFRDEVGLFTRKLGFDKFAAMLVLDQPDGQSKFLGVDNTPQAYMESFMDEVTNKTDPVMQHCKKSNLPMVWDQDTYVKAGVAEKWEHQAAFGYCCGIAVAMHLPMGRHFVMGVERDQPITGNLYDLQRKVAELQLFVVHAQDAAAKVFASAEHGAERHGLTSREVEALKWTKEGMTAAEVGTVLSISERTALMHVNNAMHKLQCTNKLQAVVKALRLGLVE